MAEKIDISVITACYNSENFIKGCIDSVQQSIVTPDNINIEHILYDDGSTDNTAEICRQYGHIIKFFRREENKGIAITLNQAIALASGTYIFVLDHDDVILQRTLYDLYKLLSKGDHAWVYTNFIRTDNELRYAIGEDYYGWSFNSSEEMLSAILKGEHFIQHNVMYTRKLYDTVGGYDENIDIFLDLDLFVRFLLNKELPYFYPITSHLHRFHDKNASIGHGGAQHMKNIKFMEKKYKNQLTQIIQMCN